MRKGVLGLIAITAVVLGGNSMAGVATWDMPSPQPAGSYISDNVTQFAEEVEGATNGALRIRVHPGGSLVPGERIKSAVQRGEVNIGVNLLSVWQNENSLYGIASVPFLANSWEDSRVLWEETKPVLNEVLAEQNLKVLYRLPWPPQGLFVNRELNTPSDADGVSFRAYNQTTARFAELMGMNSTMVEESELSQAAATGIVESLISSGDPVVSHQLWNYLPYFYDMQAWIAVTHVFVNKREWDALDQSTRDAVMNAARSAEERAEETSKGMTDDLKNALSDRGVSILDPNAEMQEEFERVGGIMRDEWLENASPAAREVVERYQRRQ